jgi:hypothetical protein
MANEHFPPRQKSLVYNGVLGIITLLVTLFLLISGSMIEHNILATGMIVLGFLLILPLLLIAYRIFTILTTVYTLNRDYLEITWGLRREVIPMGELDWIHPITDFETPLPLGFTLLKGSYYTEKEISGLGKTQFIATLPEKMVLVKHQQRFLVISPENVESFMENYELLAQMGSLQNVQAESENLKMLWQRVWTDPWARRLLSAGAISLVLLFVSGLIISLAKQQIVWVSMEYVPAARAMLMAMIGLFFGLINTFTGLLLYLQDRVAAVLRNLLWGTTVLVNLILIFALIFMAI